MPPKYVRYKRGGRWRAATNRRAQRRLEANRISQQNHAAARRYKSVWRTLAPNVAAVHSKSSSPSWAVMRITAGNRAALLWRGAGEIIRDKPEAKP